jgi:DNA processing protein
VDRSYPSGNKTLFGEIVRQGGAIVSEHPPLACTYALHHATRNRIIAGLSKALWVAEAGKESGTLHTVRAAIRMGIPIGVPPAGIGGKRGGIDWILEQNAEVSVVGPNR